MRAVVPLNVAALRVSNPDQTNVTPNFAGPTAAFDSLPYGGGTQASTGDTIALPLDNPTSQALQAGVHLHWELPEYFKRGTQSPDTGAITFPAAPTRWLVVRSLSLYDKASKGYGPVQHMSWIVESDYVAPGLSKDADGILRPAVSVPLTAASGAPFQYMGRVVEAASWDPASEQPEDYLPHYTAADGVALYLTSIGFVGAAFSSYYPDCRGVFGFWDTFADVKLGATETLYDAINANEPVRFRASYSVIGWLPDSSDDPLTTLPAKITSQYGTYVAQCASEKVAVAQTPTDVFARITSEQFGFSFSAGAIAYTLDDDHELVALDAPSATLCAGVVQDIVWAPPAPYLAAPDGATAWSDEIDVAVGNTTIEAVSALVRSQLEPPGGKGVLASYELLLDALQLGLLRDLEAQGNSLVTLEAQRHAKAFAQISGGHVWTVQTAATPGTDDTGSAEVTLPLTLAEQLDVLDLAQQAYDRGRDRLVAIRQQLFMDWVIYVKQLVANTPSPVVPTTALGNFLATASGGELNAVIDAGQAVGLLKYAVDKDTGRITGVSTTDAATTLAGQVLAAFHTVTAAIASPATEIAPPPPAWELDAAPAAPFWLPTDPVLVMQGDRLEPVRRNGPSNTIAVRVDGELVTTLGLAAGTDSWSVAATGLAAVPAPPANLPAADTVALLLGEAALLNPQYANTIAATTAAVNAAALAVALAGCQGGQSPIDAPGAGGGLYAAVHAQDYEPAPNPTSSVTAPQELTVTFTNAAKAALAPDAVGWNGQTALPELSATRIDPFLPVWLTWQVQLDPLVRRAGSAGSYTANVLEEHFALDADAIDLRYQLPAAFTTGQPVTYQGSVALSKKPTVSLTQQIDRYIEEYPHDIADDELRKARDDFAQRNVMSQAIGTFNLAQTLRTAIPQIPVADLVAQFDPLTDAIADAANATAGDSWYDTPFNSLMAMSTGLPAEYNFGPLRSGFLEIRQLGIVDVFGQIMALTTSDHTADGSLVVTPSVDLSPVAGDTANADKIYLPPRGLAPARVDAHWLSASHNDEAAGVTDDFIEMNDHPATSPVCGWIVPNHLELSLAFYGAGGEPIGSFGLEHGASVYRTRAGNTANPGDDLATDIGADGSPKPGMNAHVAALMWFIHGQPAGFLVDLMATIESSDKFINPVNFAQDVGLSVLIGRPLAVTRMVQGLSTAGGVLPISQANTSSASALAQAVQHGWTAYAARQANTCAGLDGVTFPIRLGDLTDIDDGLVAFLPEAAGVKPYATVYSAAAPAAGANRVLRPGPDTVELTLNGPARTFTAIVDPRAPVHVTTGVLPTATLRIPPDQYAQAMAQLAVTFTTRPVLRDQLSLRLPLPVEAGFSWSWVAPGEAPAPLPAAPSPDAPIYGYGPQRLLEGWLDLVPNPPAPATDEP